MILAGAQARPAAVRLALSPIKASPGRARYLEGCAASKVSSESLIQPSFNPHLTLVEDCAASKRLPFAGCVFAIEQGHDVNEQQRVVLRHQELGPLHAEALGAALRASPRCLPVGAKSLALQGLTFPREFLRNDAQGKSMKRVIKLKTNIS